MRTASPANKIIAVMHNVLDFMFLLLCLFDLNFSARLRRPGSVADILVAWSTE